MHEGVLTKQGKEIYSKLNRFKAFYLAGGTALALQIGHRISVDFDLFSDKKIPKNLLAETKKIFSGQTIIPSVNNADELTVFINGIKITFLKYPFPAIKSFVEYKGIKLLSIAELAATKAYTVGRRGSFKDYIDLYFLIVEKHVSLQGIIKLAEKKYDTDFNGRLFLEQLIYLEDITDLNIHFLKKPVSKKQIRKFFEMQIEKFKL